MKNNILTIIVSSIVATIVFGLVIYFLNNSVNYTEIIVFFVVYAVIFWLTSKYLKK